VGDDTEAGAGQASEVPQEQAVAQELVPFLGDELAAAQTAGGSVYITLPGMCRALGLGSQAQLQRIQRTAVLAKGLRAIPLRTRGGVQTVNCLRVDMVALWLAGAETGRMKPEFRAKVERYQEELAPVAMDLFMRLAGLRTADLVPAGGDPRIAALAEQIDDLGDVVAMLREHLASLATAEQVAGISLRLDQALALLGSLAERQDATETQVAHIDERTQRLTPAHAQAVREMVDRIVVETRSLPIPLTYPMLYGRLKRRFRASTYKEITDDLFDDVMDYLRDELLRATGGQSPEQGSLF
jgi:hypothetical protein